MRNLTIAAVIWASSHAMAAAQIQPASDASRPLPPTEAARSFELHGYNLDGHYDIEELNKTGQLDRVVRRIQATDEAKRKAEAGTTGTIKRLIDSGGDGVASLIQPTNFRERSQCG